MAEALRVADPQNLSPKHQGVGKEEHAEGEKAREEEQTGIA